MATRVDNTVKLKFANESRTWMFSPKKETKKGDRCVIINWMRVSFHAMYELTMKTL